MSAHGPGDARRHHGGLAAEDAALAAYEARGARLLARRWRVAEGEIDLVLEAAGVTVFVEVKARARIGADSPIGPRQKARLAAAATRWLAEHPTPACRFDAALVDRSGRVAILEHALSFDGD
ncbi:MAG: YraN family protein [Paracoccaceae bacterium]